MDAKPAPPGAAARFRTNCHHPLPRRRWAHQCGEALQFEPRGKRRIHQKPTAGEVRRYRWWLLKEIELARPGLVVALGGTAALALAGKAVSVTQARGPTTFDGRPGFVTVHPSYLLRIPDEASKAEAYAAFVADLTRVATLAGVA